MNIEDMGMIKKWCGMEEIQKEGRDVKVTEWRTNRGEK